jgi:hypothetical protein
MLPLESLGLALERQHWLRSRATLSEPRSPSIGFEVDPESVKKLSSLTRNPYIRSCSFTAY